MKRKKDLPNIRNSRCQ